MDNGEKELDLISFSSSATSEKEEKIKKKKKGKRRLLMVLLSIFLIGVITCTLIVGVFMIYFSYFVPVTVKDFDLNNPEELQAIFTTIIYVDDGDGNYKEYQRMQGDTNCVWVEYDRDAAKLKYDLQHGKKLTKEEKKKAEAYHGIPQDLVNAYVAIEDKRFYSHSGTDWKRTFAAFANMFFHFYSSNQGGSTITQQLVKNLTGHDQQKAQRKIEEIKNARYLEEHYSKDAIMECYLNQIAMGHNIEGVQVAANYYFDKNVDQLTVVECAALAAITKNPSLYSPDTNPEDNRIRRNNVLREMYSQGFINKEVYQNAKEQELEINASKSILSSGISNSYFVDALIDDITKELMKENGWDKSYANSMLYNGGYKIYATVDPEIQSAMERVYADADKYALKGKNGKTMQSAMTVMDYNGNVLGIVGGLGTKEGNRVLNRATSAVRQPGSSIKPLSVYSLAIENNYITYSTLLKDLSKSYGGWRIYNYGRTGGHGGMVTTKYALEQSLNTIPVSLLNDKIGLENSYQFITNVLGISTLTPGGNGDVNLSPLGIGGTNGGLTTFESAAAYAVFGNHGFYYEPHLYTKVLNSNGGPVRNNNGKIILNRENERGHFAISADTADVMNHLLQNVVNNGTGKRIKTFLSKMPVFGKTGTTNDEYDLWFSGGTPYYVASCWCGYDQAQRIPDTNIAKTLWGTVMKEVHNGLKVKQFEDSEEVKEAYFCPSTGLLASSTCPRKEKGWYRANNVPSYCKKCTGAPATDPSEDKPASDQPTEPTNPTEPASDPTNPGGGESSDQPVATE